MGGTALSASIRHGIVRDQEVGGSNPLAPTIVFRSGPGTWVNEIARRQFFLGAPVERCCFVGRSQLQNYLQRSDAGTIRVRRNTRCARLDGKTRMMK